MSSHITTRKKQAGFSLLEITVVVLIIGLLATIGAPILFEARTNAQRTAALSSLRRIHGAQTAYRISFNRYADLQELNAYQNNGFGQIVTPTKLLKSGYTYEFLSDAPTMANVDTGFYIQASGLSSSGAKEIYWVQENGAIMQRVPVLRSIMAFN